MLPYNDQLLLSEVVGDVSLSSQQLFSISSTIHLKKTISDIKKNNGFILNIGPCSEELSVDKFMGFYQFFIDAIYSVGKKLSKKIIPVGRLLGQTYKSRSVQYEVQNNYILPSYFGELINGSFYDEFSRSPSPIRMLVAEQYISEAKKRISQEAEVFFSHEFCEGVHVISKIQGGYLTSTNMPWIGYREMLKNNIKHSTLTKVNNPVGIKVGPTISPKNLLDIIHVLNPDNARGKIILIFRIGTSAIQDKLPKILRSLLEKNVAFTALCDPMHGNNKNIDGSKYRLMSDIKSELKIFFSVLKEYDVYPGGIHLEVTEENIIECSDSSLSEERELLSKCDPRLNKQQFYQIIDECIT